MALSFPFEKEHSSIFGLVYRPYARVLFWSRSKRDWIEILMVVDSGADYSLLPKYYIQELGIDLKKDIIEIKANGVGGSSKVFFLKGKQRIRLSGWQRTIPLGFLNSNDVPPLMGRQGFMETFRVIFDKHLTEIDIST